MRHWIQWNQKKKVPKKVDTRTHMALVEILSAFTGKIFCIQKSKVSTSIIVIFVKKGSKKKVPKSFTWHPGEFKLSNLLPQKSNPGLSST